MRTKLLIVATFALHALLAAQTAKSTAVPSEKHSATSTLEFRFLDGKEHTIIRNQRYSVIYRCLDTCSNFVLQESLFSDQEEGVEGAHETVSVAAWAKDAPGKTLWTLKAAGGEGKPLDDLYEVTWFGCCGDWNEKSYFSLRTGKKIFSSSTDDENALLAISVPNTRTKRYLTYKRPNSGKRIGQIQFGDSEAVFQTLSIREPFEGRPPTIALRVAAKPDSTSVSLWPHDGDRSATAVSGVSVVLVYEVGDRHEEVVIPIENDRMSVQRARLPKGYDWVKISLKGGSE